MCVSIPFGGVVVTDPKKADISRQNRYVLLWGYEHSNPHKLWRTSMPCHCGEGEFPKMYYWSSLWTNTVTVRKWMSLHVLNGNSPSNQFHGIVAERITNLWGPDRRRSDDIPPRWWLVPVLWSVFLSSHGVILHYLICMDPNIPFLINTPRFRQ